MGTQFYQIETLVDVQDKEFLASDKVGVVQGIIDSTQVSAGPDGKKIVKRGSIVGKNATSGKFQKATAGIKASKVFGTGNAAFQVIAKVAGPDGNLVSLEGIQQTGTSKPLTVDVVGQDVVINLGTDASGNPASTASDIIAALNSTLQFAALADAVLAPGSDGSGVVSEFAETNLAGGADAAGFTGDFFILAKDCDVTKGDAPATAYYMARVYEEALPDAPLDPSVKARLSKLITFA